MLEWYDVSERSPTSTAGDTLRVAIHAAGENRDVSDTLASSTWKLHSLLFEYMHPARLWLGELIAFWLRGVS